MELIIHSLITQHTVYQKALIKMCELLDDEYKNINTFIIGPGFTKTKTHIETLKAGKKAGSNYLRVKKFLKSKNTGTPFIKIFECIKWGIKEGKKWLEVEIYLSFMTNKI